MQQVECDAPQTTDFISFLIEGAKPLCFFHCLSLLIIAVLTYTEKCYTTFNIAESFERHVFLVTECQKVKPSWLLHDFLLVTQHYVIS